MTSFRGANSRDLPRLWIFCRGPVDLLDFWGGSRNNSRRFTAALRGVL
jgi:hypothetical protein